MMTIAATADRIAVTVALLGPEWTLISDAFAGRVQSLDGAADRELRNAVGYRLEDGATAFFDVRGDFWSRLRALTEEDAQAVLEMNDIFWTDDTNWIVVKAIAERPCR